MKALIYKELKLCLNPQILIFLFLSGLVAIPSWPSLTAFVYPLAGLLVLFSSSAANHDIEFAAMLPIAKKDVVKGKIILVLLLEMASVIISIPFAIIKVLIMNPMMPADQKYPELGINFALYGFVFLIYGIFNLLFLCLYYKNLSHPIIPQLIATITSSLILMIIMICFILLPGVSVLVNQFEGSGLYLQLGIFFGGIIILLISSFLGLKVAQKDFEVVDL